MAEKEYPHLLVEVDPEYGDVRIYESRVWVKNPTTGEKETIINQWNAKNSICCSNCKAKGH